MKLSPWNAHSYGPPIKNSSSSRGLSLSFQTDRYSLPTVISLALVTLLSLTFIAALSASICLQFTPRQVCGREILTFSIRPPPLSPVSHTKKALQKFPTLPPHLPQVKRAFQEHRTAPPDATGGPLPDGGGRGEEGVPASRSPLAAAAVAEGTESPSVRAEGKLLRISTMPVTMNSMTRSAWPDEREGPDAPIGGRTSGGRGGLAAVDSEGAFGQPYPSGVGGHQACAATGDPLRWGVGCGQDRHQHASIVDSGPSPSRRWGGIS